MEEEVDAGSSLLTSSQSAGTTCVCQPSGGASLLPILPVFVVPLLSLSLLLVFSLLLVLCSI